MLHERMFSIQAAGTCLGYRSMWINLLLGTLVLGLVLLIVVALVQRIRIDRERDRLVRDVLEPSRLAPAMSVRMTQTEGVPAPVRRYLNHVLRDGQAYVRTVRMKQDGTFREGDPTSHWNSFRATQHVGVQPPGFVWDAKIQIMPWVPVRVIDRYVGGRGGLRAHLGGVLPVMSGEPGAALDEGELLRYLGEAPLYPTALLPRMGVTWAAIDDRSARATLVDETTTASLVFTFNDENEVVRVSGRRPFTKEDGSTEYRLWTGYWRDYVSRNGMLVPRQGEVAWVVPDVGEVTYWRGNISSIEYNFEEPSTPATASSLWSIPEAALGVADAS